VVLWVILAGVVVGLMPAAAQEREDRTLLTWEQMRAIINEASGDRALQTVLEMVPYPRVRTRAEYEGHFRDSEVVAQRAREYGFSNVQIESFPTQGRSWLASVAELWMVKPEQRKLYDVNDVVISICSGSESGDVTAELVDVGVGTRAEDYAGKDVAGKIVLGSGSASALQRMAVFERGAVGVLSYSALRSDSFPDQILSSGISASAPQGKKPGFGWAISPRVGHELAARLARGEKITLRSVVQSETFPGEMEIVSAVIPGDASSDQEIAVSAHLYEGYIKQGANDDASGCALTLEMGRAFLRLVNEGKLPRPKRTLRFLWVPEISGTRVWLDAHPDIRKKTIADLNFDMVGINLRVSGSLWTMHRTPDTLPTFLSDIGQSLMEFLAGLNRERIQYRSSGYRYTLPVVSPNGSNDPFYISVEKYYGASDHAVYIGLGIPAVIWSTWPDMFYHSSFDIPQQLDPTQFKRAAVVSLGAMTVLATADDVMAARVAAESLARGTERMGAAQRKGLSYMADVTDAAQLAGSYREAQVAVRHQQEIEKAVVQSAAVLFSNPAEAQKKLAAFAALIEQRGAALQNEVKAFYQHQAGLWKVEAAEPALSDAEKAAAKLIPERVATQPGGPGGFGAMQQAMQRLTPEERAAFMSALVKIPGHISGELSTLLGQNAERKRTVLEIRDFLSGEFDPLPVADLMGYFRVLEKAGQLKFTEKPEEPKLVPPKKGAKVKK
jgi:hypothetical protein